MPDILLYYSILNSYMCQFCYASASGFEPSCYYRPMDLIYDRYDAMVYLIRREGRQCNSNDKGTLMPQENLPQSSFRTSLTSLFMAAIVMILAIAGSIFSQPIAHAWSLATTHKPETFTELYFNTSKANPLPTSTPVGQVRTFSFHLTNHERRNYHYAYRVQMNINGRTFPIVTGSVELPSEAGKDITVPFTVPVAEAHPEITVILISPAEQISFRSES